MNISIDYAKCCWRDGKCSCDCGGDECTGCVEVCPVQAITREEKVVIDTAQCLGCGACVAVCKQGAITLES